MTVVNTNGRGALTVMCRKGSVVHRGGGGGAMQWGCLFDEAAIARGDHLLAGPLAEPWAIELLWYPDVRGRLGGAQRAKPSSQHRRLQERRPQR